jgi:hypothetical protein
MQCPLLGAKRTSAAVLTEKEPGREVSSQPGRIMPRPFCARRDGGEAFRPLCAVVLERVTCALDPCDCGIML